jgi:hypothetical protein
LRVPHSVCCLHEASPTVDIRRSTLQPFAQTTQAKPVPSKRESQYVI